MANQIMRITLKAYDHKLIDQAAGQIIDTVKRQELKSADRFQCLQRLRRSQSSELFISTKIQENSSSRELIRD